MVADANADVAYWAVTLLGRLNSEAAAAVPALIAAMNGPAVLAVRQRAAWALGQIGRAATTALPALQEAAKASDSRLARLANEAIGRIEA